MTRDLVKVGYARVSSVGQSLGVQREKLAAGGIDRIFEETRSGVESNRPVLRRCLDYVRDGDLLVFTRVDRLARSAADRLNIVDDLTDRHVAIKVIDRPIDTSDAADRAFLGMLAIFAEFENDIRKERQMDGIDKAKARGIQFGRKLQLTSEMISEIKAMRSDGDAIKAILADAGLSKASDYRALAR